MAGMTWSIIARDQATGQFGIAVASRFFAVGALVPRVKSRIGAIATQALVNAFFGTEGLRLLEQGATAPEVVSAVTAADAGRDHRQVHVMDSQNRIAAHTGKACIDWCGHLAGDNFSVACNMLGGDKRGKQSAALVICGDQEWPDLDLRVDDHTDPLAELERLEKVSRERFVHFMRMLPSRRDRVGVTDRDAVESEIAKALAAEGSS